MGSALSTARDQLVNTTAEADRKKVDDSLNSLFELAETQHKLFDAQVHNREFDTMLIPIDKILHSSYQIYAKTAQDVTDSQVGDNVTQAIGDFATGEFKDGIIKTLKAGLTVLLGGYSGSKSEKRDYLVSIGDLGGIYRIDYFFFAYKFTSQEIVKTIREVVCVSLVVSSVKVTHDALSRNTIDCLIQAKYSSETPEKRVQLRNLAMAEINETLLYDARQQKALLEATASMANTSLVAPSPPVGAR